MPTYRLVLAATCLMAAVAAGCGAVRAEKASSPPPRTAARPPRPMPDPALAGCDLGPDRLAELGATIRMASVTTVYPHSPPNRNQNLAVASRYLCGRVLAPGRTLSFNAAIGLTTRERGYTYGPTFVGDRVVPGMGGGVCQVATTLYDAARAAGIQVLERHAHGMRVPYVPPGEDATVSHPWLDLVIRNSTAGPLVVAAVGQANRVTVSLYGTEAPPRTAFRHEILSTTPYPTLRIADPSLPRGREVTVQAGVDGTVAHTWYVVQRPGQPERVYDLGIDRYRPSPHIIRYGVGTQADGATPADKAKAGQAHP